MLRLKYFSALIVVDIFIKINNLQNYHWIYNQGIVD